MPVIGIPAFNAVAILKIDPINFATNDVRLIGHGAFVNADTGVTYGQTTCTHWSKRTLEKLAELRAAMEEDLASLVFVRSSTPTSPGPVLSQTEPGGIGESVRGSTDAPQL